MTGIFISIFGEKRTMKKVSKSLVVGLMVLALSFSPVLASLAKAGGFNFEGISSIKNDDTQNYEKQPRGLMFKFSFGGPKDYKMPKSQVTMWDLDESEKQGLVLVAVYIGIFVLLEANKDEDSD